jgi:S1-C subfamily serine protease
VSTHCRITCTAITGQFLLAAATFAVAQDRGSPPLGIHGRFEHGYGQVVERVRWGSPAGRIGLEPGDVIRAIDGRWLRTEADYRRQLRRAEVSALLIVRDVRTGKLLRRPVQLR